MFKKIASNTMAQVGSKAASAIISIFLISILTNYLTIELFGLYSKVYSYTGIFVFLADLGLYAIVIREITNNKKDSEKIIGNVMTLRLMLGVFVLFLAVVIAYFLPGYNSDLALITIFIASIFTIFQLINSSLLALMQANMKIEFSAISLILAKLVNLGLVGLVVYYFFTKPSIDSFDTSFIYIFLAGVIGALVNTVLNYYYAKNIIKIGFRFDWKYIKHIFKLSLPYGLALFLSVVYFKMDIIIISLIEGPDLGDLSIALYSLPMKIVEVLMVIGGFYMTSLLPSLTDAFKKKSKKKVNSLISISFKVLFGSATMIFVLGVLFRDYLIEIIANKNYLEAAHMFNSSDAFLVVFAVIVFYFISLIFIYSLVASNNQGKLLKINIYVTIFNIVGNILLIPKYSFIGAGVVTLLSQLILVFLGYYYTKNIIDFCLPYKFIFNNIVIAILIYVSGYFLLTNYPLGLYLDFILYGGVLFCIYSYILYTSFRKIGSKELN